MLTKNTTKDASITNAEKSRHLELADGFLLVPLKDFCGELIKKKLSLTNCRV